MPHFPHNLLSFSHGTEYDGSSHGFSPTFLFILLTKTLGTKSPLIILISQALLHLKQFVLLNLQGNFLLQIHYLFSIHRYQSISYIFIEIHWNFSFSFHKITNHFLFRSSQNSISSVSNSEFLFFLTPKNHTVPSSPFVCKQFHT